MALLSVTQLGIEAPQSARQRTAIEVAIAMKVMPHSVQAALTLREVLVVTLRLALASLMLAVQPALDARASEQGNGQPLLPQPSATEQIAAFLEAHHEHAAFSGAVLVADQGEIIYQAAYGLANHDWEIDNQIDTRFRLASLTKQFTAMVVMLLVEDELLELDATIGRYLPDYAGEARDRVTIHQLLNHTSGIPNYTSRPGFMRQDARQFRTVADFVATYCSDPLAFEPGTRFEYSNSGYYLLGAIIERVTGEEYADVLRARVLEPLGMHETRVDDAMAVIPNRAAGYVHLLGEARLANWVEMGSAYSAGGMLSTVGDMWTWAQAMQDKRLLDGDLEDRMMTPGLGNYAYGWHVDGARSPNPEHWHTGSISGYATVISRFPAREQCIVILSNSASAQVNFMALGLAGILRGESPEPPQARIEETLARVVLEQGVDAGLEMLAQIESEAERAALSPSLGRLGFLLMGQRRTRDAITLLTFNTRAFPRIPDAWHGLAEAHRLVGSRSDAIAAGRAALSLDPDHPGTARLMAELGEGVTGAESDLTSDGQ